MQCIMHMTISIVIMQVTVSVVAMYVTVSSIKFIFLSLIPIFRKIDQKTSEGRRHYIKFAFHHSSKYSSKIKILCGKNLDKSQLKDSFITFVFLIDL